MADTAVWQKQHLQIWCRQADCRLICLYIAPLDEAVKVSAVRTLMSFLRLRLKQQYRILRWPGLRPSTTEGMERSKSARLNRISSCALQQHAADGFSSTPEHFAIASMRHSNALCEPLQAR
jgi:hypothetical protein